jgi:WD40 repeat protein
MASCRTSFLSVLLLTFLQTFSPAQQCEAPAYRSSKSPVMINAEQEYVLGQAMVAKELTATRTIEAEDLNAPLQKIVERLIAISPPSSTKFRVRIIESSNASAYTFLGGQVFVSRRALVLARNEDEVAGVLAHEMGHTLTRQTARDYETLLQAVLDVKTLATKDNVEDRYHEFLEKLVTRPGAVIEAAMKIASREGKEQIEADQVSLYLLNRAGYKPEAFIDYFDRLTGNKGKIGSGWSEFFHTTKPESKRVREMLKSSAVMPESCKLSAGRMSTDEFARWQSALKVYSAFGKVDNVPGGHKYDLKDPLRSDIAQLQFSPDGNYIIAQDAASVYVVSRNPFTTLFRFDAEDAHKARFTPDSQNVVFGTDSGRVEKWNIAQKTQVAASEVHMAHPCRQLTLSATGEYLACVQANDKGEYPLQLAIVDVETGEPIWTQKGVVKESTYTFLSYVFSLAPKHISMEFSPDGKYLAAAGDNGPILFDMEKRTPLPIAPALKKVMKHFVFLSNDQVLSYNDESKSIGTVAKFPSGEIVSEMPMPPNSGSRTGNSSVLAIRPYLHSAAALVDISTKKILGTSQTPALDLFGNFSVTEGRSGQLALWDGSSMQPIGVTTLSKGPLVRFEAISFSGDGHFLTYSDFSRGGLWEVENGTRLSLLRGFRGAYFDGNKQMFVLFPAADSYHGAQGVTKQEAKSIGKEEWRAEESKKVGTSLVQFDIENNKVQELRQFAKRYSVTQHGSTAMVLAWADEHGNRLDTIDYEFHDVATGKKLWNRDLGKLPPMLYFTPAGSTAIFAWYADNDPAKPLLKDNRELAAIVNHFPKGRDGAWLLEVLDERTGKRRFLLPIDTGQGSFKILDVDAVGNTLVYADDNDRLVVYDSTGKRLGRIFGRRPTLNPTGRLMAVQTEPGRLVLYTTSDLQKKKVFTFSARVAYSAFSDDSKKLFVMTSDQVVWAIDVSQ